RNLLAHMLHGNPDKRPQDLAALEKEILKCLGKIEKRHAFGRRLGIPLAAAIPKEPKTPPTPLVQVLRGTLVVAALLLAVGVAGAFLLPDDINPFRHRTAAKQVIGVPIGVPNPSASPSAQATNAAPIAGNQAIANASPTSQNPPPNILQDQTANSQSPGAATPATPNVNSSASTQTDTSGQEQAASSGQANVAPQPPIANESSSPTQRERAAGLTS